MSLFKALDEVGVDEHERVDMRRHLGVFTTESSQQLLKIRYRPALLSLGARVIDERMGQRLKVAKTRPVIVMHQL